MEQVTPAVSKGDQPEKDKDAKKSKIISALAIGFLAGVVMFGLISVIYSENYVVILPLLFPIFFIYKILDKSKKKTSN
ncbi:hypothetical protein [Psychroflexus lacisalsi]|jgi:hypothetical protein|uniref:FUSC family protein n=1 Tax=Psychroflexus lacisalsi TaxID=503928 RepID=A0ABN1K1V8_9FLAO|nr:hypothetical protein [Psychroflexus lacisalsi]MBZ9620780.1 hypothetical protein [Psychroflexus lacisalsi]